MNVKFAQWPLREVLARVMERMPERLCTLSLWPLEKFMCIACCLWCRWYDPNMNIAQCAMRYMLHSKTEGLPDGRRSRRHNLNIKIAPWPRRLVLQFGT